MTIITKNESETRAFAASMAGKYKTFLLSGDLGSGKTAFIKGFCIAMGVPEEQIHSPSFAIVNEYIAQNNEKIYHFDAYRLTPVSWLEGGFDEYLESGICLIEWADNLNEICLPKEGINAIKITIKGSGDEPRCITIKN